MEIISSIGNFVTKNRAALIKGKCGISQLEFISSKYSGKLPSGEIKISTETLKQKLSVSAKGVSRTSLLALHAFEEALSDSKLTAEELTAYDTAFIGASTVGGMCLTVELYSDAHKSENGSEYLSSYEFSTVNLFLQSHYKLKGIVNTINTACSSSANSIMYGARLIKSGKAKRAIAGGADSLAKFTINGFNALHILSHEICTPFDDQRKGLNLGEGAAFLVLEREEDCKNKKVYGYVSGYCNASDAFHPSSLSEQGDGPFAAMSGALRSAALSPDKINFINTHGTGTENNDEVESTAILRLFDKPPAFSSTKSNIGHTLGAAGAIEAVYSILNLEYQEIYASLNFKNAIEKTGLKPVLSYSKSAMENVMSNSFGFGGNCTSLIFSKA